MIKKKIIQNKKERTNYLLFINSFVDMKNKKTKFFKKHRFINTYLMLCVPSYIILIYLSDWIFDISNLYYSLYVSIVVFVLVYESIKYMIMKNKKIPIGKIISEILLQKPDAEFGFENSDFLIYSTELIIDGNDIVVEFTIPKEYNTYSGVIRLDETIMEVWKNYITNTY
jgi:hypothetical protein